jgi:hypothetical protein
VIVAGKDAGRFRTIRLTVKGNDVFMRDLKVIYGNGDPEELRVHTLIRAGTASNNLDLKGDRRGIARVEMTYQARPEFTGGAEVCVEGAR